VFEDFLLYVKYPLTSVGVFLSLPSLHAWKQVPVISSYILRTVCMLPILRGAYSKTGSAPMLLPMEHIPAHGAGKERGSKGQKHSAHQL